eukprot:7112769-Prymnesium_polylepis.2
MLNMPHAPRLMLHPAHRREPQLEGGRKQATSGGAILLHCTAAAKLQPARSSHRRPPSDAARGYGTREEDALRSFDPHVDPFR